MNERRPSITPFARVLVLLLLLAGFWLILSGFFKPLLLGLGAASCAFVAWLTLRKSLIGTEPSLLVQLRWGRWLRYQVWLVGQIIRSNIEVTRYILDPALPITPTVARVPADLSDLGKVIYANSITLTPGTVSIDIGQDGILVHALTSRIMEELQSGEMYRRVRELEKQGV